MDIKIKIEGGGLSFEGETDIVKAAQVIAFIKSDSIPNPTKPAALLTGQPEQWPGQAARQQLAVRLK